MANVTWLIPPGLLGWVLGSALQLQQPELFAPWVYGAWALVAVAAGVALWQGDSGAVWRPLVAVFAAGLMAFSATGLRAGWYQSGALDPAIEGQDVLVTGVVAAMPQRNEDGLRFRFDIESARLGLVEINLPQRIYLSWYSGPVDRAAEPSPSPGQTRLQGGDLAAGERWQLAVRLKSPHGGSNPHGFDYELWLWEQGLQATGYVRAGPKDAAPQRLARTMAHPVERARQWARDRIVEHINDRKQAGVIAALVVGDQNAIDRADWDVFRATGVAHLMSISGLHITMFAWVAMLATRWLWRRSAHLCFALPAPTAGLVIGASLALLYAVFSGWGVPAQRTVLMLAVVSVLRIGARRWPWPQVWLLACAAVVAVDPWAILQAGFWLSFVAVGVLFASGAGPQPAEAQGAGRTRLPGFLATAARLMREQWTITLALAPLTLLLFGQVSVVGLGANLLAIPWVTLVVTPLAMLGVVFSAFWSLAGWAIQVLAWFLTHLSLLPFATLTIAQAPVWAGAIGVLGGVLLVMRLPWPMRLLGLPMLMPILLWQAARPAVGEFELLAADIGQGNAVIVRTATHALLYDSGPRFSRESDAGHRVLVPLLRALDVTLDSVMLSHRDADHTGGALAVLAMQPQATLISSIEEQHEIQNVRKVARCEAGQHWRWDGVDFDVLHPEVDDYTSIAKSNALSCVLKISSGRQTALLAGDIELEQEASLVGQAAVGHINLKSTVLLVPHHGSLTSSTSVFLDAVQPRLAVIQNGYRNRFGHPAAPVVARYQARGIRLYDSPHCGAATWHSAEPDAVQCDRQQRQRYWNHRVP